MNYQIGEQALRELTVADATKHSYPLCVRCKVKMDALGRHGDRVVFECKKCTAQQLSELPYQAWVDYPDLVARVAAAERRANEAERERDKEKASVSAKMVLLRLIGKDLGVTGGVVEESAISCTTYIRSAIKTLEEQNGKLREALEGLLSNAWLAESMKSAETCNMADADEIPEYKSDCKALSKVAKAARAALTPSTPSATPAVAQANTETSFKICPECGGWGSLGNAADGRLIACETCGGHEDSLGTGEVEFQASPAKSPAVSEAERAVVEAAIEWWKTDTEEFPPPHDERLNKAVDALLTLTKSDVKGNV